MKKMFVDTEIQVEGIRLTEGKLETELPSEQKISDLLPSIQGIAQYFHAEANALPYFLYIDSLIREMASKLFSSRKESRQA